MQINLYLSPCTILKSKLIKDLNIKPTTLNLTEEKMRNSLGHIGTGDLNILSKYNPSSTDTESNN